MTEDTYRGNASDPLSLNLYSYCSNEPVMYYDPTGHWQESGTPRPPGYQADPYRLKGNPSSRSKGGYSSSGSGYVPTPIFPNLDFAASGLDYMHFGIGSVVTVNNNQYVVVPDGAGGVIGLWVNPTLFTNFGKSTNDIMANRTASRDGYFRIDTSNGISINNINLYLSASNLRVYEESLRLYGNNDKKRAQYLLSHIGFDVYRGSPDGALGVRSTSAIIMTQWVAGIPMTGDVDRATLDALTIYALYGVSRKAIMDVPWTLEATVRQSKEFNGNFEGATTRIPSAEGPAAYLQPNAAVGWARLVQGAIDYNETLAGKSAPLDINNFAAKGISAGYRDYHKQVEAYAIYVHGGNEAWRPIFTNSNFGSQESAKEWILKNITITSTTVWNNVDPSLTVKGGILAGYGQSNHGFGVALDFKFSTASSREFSWLNKMTSDGTTTNAAKYGFENYKPEAWHWNYTK